MDLAGSSDQSSYAPVTVVVVNCNGAAETLKCLMSVSTSDPLPERVVLVDNGSTDGTRDMIEQEYSSAVPLTALWLPTNVGLAEARNRAAESVTTPFIAFLDNDTVVSATWLKAALETLDAFSADCVQCTLLLATDQTRLDSVGYLLGPFGFPRHIVRPGAIDTPEHRLPRLLFGVKAAAMVIRRRALERAGGFDPAFFIYGEETDLCWRLLRSGSRIALASQSVVLHNAGGTSRFLPNKAESLLYRGGPRNYIHMVAKNSPAKRVVVDVAGQITIWLGLACVELLRGKGKRARLIALGTMDAVALLPRIVRHRRASLLPFVETPKELRMGFNIRYLWRIVTAT
jgi:GT2 family glycosyltransferase